MGKLSFIIGLILLSGQVLAQDEEKRNIYFGNQAFDEGNFDEAIAYYQEAIKHSPLGFKAHFNMGNAYFRKKDVKTASDIYTSIVDLAPTAYDQSKVHYNLGNCQLLSNQIDPAIDSYKAALRINPNDENARYNLAYALHLRQQQPPKQDKEKQENDQQDENDGQDEQQRNDEPQDEQDGNGDNSSGSGQNQPDGEGNNGAVPEKISKEQARKILEAALRREKEVQKKIDQKKVVGTGSSGKKDW
jgi:Ca-activated chloride channel homolog